MKLSRHHERAIIKALLNVSFCVPMEETKWEDVCKAVAQSLKETHPKFKEKRFLEELGILHADNS